ncbi:HAD-IA family hydrolase [Paenibacillus turpanensis]|uniref:HAD-IA family hydrolase n=1 Tax=Paenibacillus turpanensis TaxID=2689078 RepID=UPI00140A1F61|nr:HAD-IA family hydrolase [Paenibacillus turpanensis]
MRYEAIFFDAGDTLMTILEAQSIVHQFLKDRSLHREPEQIGSLFQEAFQTFYYNKGQGEPVPVSAETDREFWSGIYRYIMDHLGVHEEWSAEQIHRCCHELYDIFTGPEHYRLFDDVIPVLEQLKAKGYRLAVISNFAPTLSAILKEKGIDAYFEDIFVSTVVGLEKPDPAIFSLALERTALKADQVLYVGDHAVNDIWAPNQVGIDAVRILRYDYQEGEGIRSLEELLSYLEGTTRK